MKKSTIGRLIKAGLVAGALTLFPAKASSLDNLVNGVGTVKGNVIETISESNVNLRFKEYLGNGIIGACEKI